MLDWTLTLPRDLQRDIQGLVQRDGGAESVLNRLYSILAPPPESQPPAKKPCLESPPPALGDACGLIRITEPIQDSTIIFELTQILFQSPFRKKMNFTFHLVEQNGNPTPVLSIVNPTTATPDYSIINLAQAVKSCFLVPILGNLTNSQKKNVVSLGLWLHEHASSKAPSSLSRDPIVCSLNLDLIRKQMVRTGKLPANADLLVQADGTRLAHEHDLSPIQGRLIDYFQRQFKLCGISLLNALPCCGNSLDYNTDVLVRVSTPERGCVIVLEAHNRAKDGSLFLVSCPDLSPYIVFGYKKPILFYDAQSIKLIQYANISRLTYSILITVVIESKEEVIEFSMIDQQSFPVVDEFVKRHNITDDSFNQELREKPEAQLKDGASSTRHEADKLNPQSVVTLSQMTQDVGDDETEDESYDEDAANATEDASLIGSGSDMGLENGDTDDFHAEAAGLEEEQNGRSRDNAENDATRGPTQHQTSNSLNHPRQNGDLDGESDTVFSHQVEEEA